MPPTIAALLCAVGVLGLFFLNRDETSHTSKALWIPLSWILIVSSRPVSAWLHLGEPVSAVDVSMGEGSPLDRNVFTALLVAGICVLMARSHVLGSALRSNMPVVLFFSYCLVSVIWSDFPDVAAKRWMKGVGEMVMALVVLTEPDTVAALKKLLSRAGLLLLPTSILFIRYFGELGRGYDPDGIPMNTGVTTNKNTLGVITFILSLGALCQIVSLLRDPDQLHRARRLCAQCSLLVCGVTLLVQAQSATSQLCFILGAVVILATNLPIMRRSLAALHTLIASIVLGASTVMLSGNVAEVLHLIGRKSNLTGRTDIWAAVLRVASDPLLGAGYESFWLGPRVARVWSQLSQYMHVNEAHNGYLEVYLNLGFVGVTFILVLLITAYRRSTATFQYDPGAGSLMLAYVVCAATYSISEAGFRLLNPIWIVLLIVTTQIPERFAPEAPDFADDEPQQENSWTLDRESTIPSHSLLRT